jgi:hypothetical protein
MKLRNQACSLAEQPASTCNRRKAPTCDRLSRSLRYRPGLPLAVQVDRTVSSLSRIELLLHDHRRAPGPGGRRPETVGKDVAKSALLTIGPGPFVSQSGGDRASPPIAPKPSAASPPAARSLPALRGRDGLVHHLVDAEDLRQSGDLQDFQDPLLRADQIQRFRRRRSPQLLVYGVQQLGRSHALGRSGP